MIHWEDKGCDHVYTIGTPEEIIKELLERVKSEVNDAQKNDTWRDCIYDIAKYIGLLTDIDENAERGKLIALTPDTPTGELGWYYVNDIDIDLHW